jgi:predicted PurR-regulated permease PerM
VPRVISFILLVAILILIGSMFFQVVVQFAVPLFLAAVLVVIFDPMHQRVCAKFPRRPRLCALTTTSFIMLIVLVPTSWLGWKAYVECARVVTYLNELQHQQAEKRHVAEAGTKAIANPAVLPESAAEPSPGAATEPIVTAPSSATEKEEKDKNPDNIFTAPLEIIKERYKQLTGGLELKTEGLIENAAAMIGGTLISSVQALLNLGLGLVIMILALYYFLADGPAMIKTAMRQSPLDDAYEQELLDKFANVSRAVVVASLASAVVQGLLAGIGYYFALPAGAPIFLLTMLSMLLAVVPFFGAAAVWAPTAAWIYLAQGADAAGGDATTRALLLALWGAGVVSTVDNFIKPYVLHGQSNMHPLLALISVLGGVKVLGPIGLLVGPMLVAFVQAILNMLNKEIKIMGSEAAMEKADLEHVTAINPAARLEAEAAAGSAGLIDQLAAVAPLPGGAPGKRPSEPPAAKAGGVKRRRKRK